MPRPSVNEIRGVGNFAKLYQWNWILETPPSAGNFAAFGANGGTPLNLRCESVELPKLTGESIITSIRGQKIKEPGIYTYAGTQTFIFVETVDNIVSNFLREWRELCWQAVTGIQEAKADVEAVVKIQRLNSTDDPVFEYKMTGCFLEDFDLGTLDGTTSDVFKPNMIMSYDFFEDQALT